jgi:3-hydroxyacyl-[acyl-carrier-protein] dehydratase
VEAGAWLIRLSEDYQHSVIVLREARGVKYGSFMEPGWQMAISVDLVERAEGTATLKGKGMAEGQTTVSARLTLATYNLRDHDPTLAEVDEQLVRSLRSLGRMLQQRPTGNARGS